MSETPSFMRTVERVEYLNDRAVFIMDCGHDCSVFNAHAPVLPEVGSRRHCHICAEWARKPWPILRQARS